MSMFPAKGTKRGTEKEMWLDSAVREHATTVRVLEAFPPDKLDLKPTPKSMSARDLAYLFVREQAMLKKALTTGFDWSSTPPSGPPVPATLLEIIQALGGAHAQVVDLVRGMSDAELKSRTAHFFTGPNQMDYIPMLDFLWMVLHDQIHHRGQMTVYSRLAGGKVPSVYGPSADEPWM
jgi:uncharacterized damage-inducible protein DinB